MVGPQFSQTYGMSWLTSLQDGAPEVGWSQASLYLIAPLILIAIQITIQVVNSPPIREQTVTTRAIQLIPFMSGLTALASPAGMSVYWVTNATLSLVQSVTARNVLRDEGLDMWEMDRLQKEEYEKEAQLLEQQKARLAAEEAARQRQAEERERAKKEKEEKKREREMAMEEKKKKEQEEREQKEREAKAKAEEEQAAKEAAQNQQQSPTETVSEATDGKAEAESSP